MIHSMTGFGRASGNIGDRFVVAVTVKSVNHKFLETSVRLPESMWELEPMVRSLASDVFSRGKVDVTIRTQRTSEPEYLTRINRRIAETLIPQLRSLMEELDMKPTLSASDLLRVPDLVQIEPVEAGWEEGDRDELKIIVKSAFARVTEMRAAEGIGLREDIEKHLTAVEDYRTELDKLRDVVVRESLDQYRARVQELSRAAGIEIDQDRLAQETVLMVEKGDIAEELTRMEIHLGQMRSLIRGEEPVGKKLDFLSQETLREINTIGSKSRSATIRSLVVELKTEVERIREQVQNVE